MKMPRTQRRHRQGRRGRLIRTQTQPARRQSRGGNRRAEARWRGEVRALVVPLDLKTARSSGCHQKATRWRQLGEATGLGSTKTCSDGDRKERDTLSHIEALQYLSITSKVGPSNVFVARGSRAQSLCAGRDSEKSAFSTTTAIALAQDQGGGGGSAPREETEGISLPTARLPAA